jgi:Undecaprenyl-phosphate glucose phosphotransferase
MTKAQKQEEWPKPSQHSMALSSEVTASLFYFLDGLFIILLGAGLHQLLIGNNLLEQQDYQFAIVFLAFITVLVQHYGSLYQFNALLDPVKILHRIFLAVSISFLLLFAILFSLKASEYYSRIWVFSYGAGCVVGIATMRLISFFLISYLAKRKVLCRNVLILGCKKQAEQLITKLKNVKPNLNNIIGIFDDRKDRVAPELNGVPVLGTMDDLVDYVRKNDINDVIITLPWNADERLLAIIARLRELPVHINLGADLVTFRFPYRPSPNHFIGVPMMEVISAPLAGWNSLIKNIEDKILGAIIIILFSPVLLLVALAIKLESPGPVLFKQKRYGYNNKIFEIYKFRSMYHKQIPDSVTKQATKGDPRITKVGSFIRKTSLDELPQLFNVLNGTMSLVGPRPHATDHNEEYSELIEGYFARHRVKPGITGWAQVHGLRGETDTLDKMEARVNYDTYYAENWSLQLDFQILVMTAFVGFVHKNAY